MVTRSRAEAAATLECDDLELFLGLPEVALAEVCAARGDAELAAPAVAAAHRRLEAIAATLVDAEARARFWSRRMANDRLATWARRLADDRPSSG